MLIPFPEFVLLPHLPQTIAFSGNGSKTLKVLSTDKKTLAQFAQIIFENLSPDEMDAILNKQSGVQAISGISSDDRDICKAQEKGDERAILAHEMQAYEIAKFIGSYVAAMNGVDAIVFTGGIGENGVWLRSKVCSYLGYLGVHINEAVNSKTQKGAEAELTEPTDNVRVFILATDEELMIARDTEELVKSL